MQRPLLANVHEENRSNRSLYWGPTLGRGEGTLIWIKSTLLNNHAAVGIVSAGQMQSIQNFDAEMAAVDELNQAVFL